MVICKMEFSRWQLMDEEIELDVFLRQQLLSKLKVFLGTKRGQKLKHHALEENNLRTLIIVTLFMVKGF